jgi:hypothetical protein
VAGRTGAVMREISVRLPVDQIDKLQRIADLCGWPLDTVISIAIGEYLVRCAEIDALRAEIERKMRSPDDQDQQAG